MYKVSRQLHKKHGNVIEITRDEAGEHKTPFEAFNKASRMRRLWLEESKSKIRFLVDEQVMTQSQADSWSINEYKSLPKCEECAKILSGDVYTHSLCGSNLFCSPTCSDKNYAFQMEKMNDNEESEFECF